MVYLVTGILFNKYHKGATGKEVIPNISFWTDFPLLVKVRINIEGKKSVFMPP